MTHGHHHSEQRRRPSWYSGGLGEPAGEQDAARAPNPHQPYRHAPSAAQAGGYGAPPMGHAQPGGGSLSHPGQPSDPGIPPATHYSPTPGTDELNRSHDQEFAQAQSAATAALVLAIVGFFTAPFIMGPLAIWQATKARRLGHDAGAALVLGWICTVWGAAIVVLPFLLFLLVLVGAGL